MVTLNKDLYNGLKGIIYHENEVIGVCESADTFLDLCSQIKAEQSDKYKMEVEAKMANGAKRTYVYHFTKNGTLVPLHYSGVDLWTDILNERLLHLYNFEVRHDFKTV
jgi:hypothetical protein